MENLAVNIGGLKCDNPDCNYRDDSIKLEQYEDYINEPCPVCGSPLLKQYEYELGGYYGLKNIQSEEIGSK